jgi:hypothetical protein
MFHCSASVGRLKMILANRERNVQNDLVLVKRFVFDFSPRRRQAQTYTVHERPVGEFAHRLWCGEALKRPADTGKPLETG